MHDRQAAQSSKPNARNPRPGRATESLPSLAPRRNSAVSGPRPSPPAPAAWAPALFAPRPVGRESGKGSGQSAPSIVVSHPGFSICILERPSKRGGIQHSAFSFLLSTFCLLSLHRLPQRVDAVKEPVCRAAGRTVNFAAGVRASPADDVHQTEVPIGRTEVFEHQLSAARAELPAPHSLL